MISKGVIFQNCGSDGCWARYLYPVPLSGAATPTFVSGVIRRAVYGKNAFRIQWDARRYICRHI